MAFGAWSQVFDPEVWSASQWNTKYYSLRIYYRYRQDVAANVTQFELQGFRFYTLTSARGIHGATLHGYFSVNYIDQGYKTVLNNMPSPPGNVYLPYNMTVDVPHNQDGTYNSNLYIAWRFYVTGSGDSIQPNITTSQRVNPSIPKIPRVSSADVTSPSLTMGSKQTIKIGRQTTSYTHNLYYKFQGQSSWTAIASNVNADTYDWTVPTSLATLIPNATSGTCQILVRTMSGTTQIGDSIASFTANVPSSVVPSISSVAVAETTSGLATQFGAFIQSKSGYKCTISASGASGSTIKTYRVEMDGKSASGSGNVLTLPSTSSSGSLTLKTTVTDSRGRSATKSQTVSVLAYTGPKCSLAVARCNASGALDDEGTKIKITYNFAITALNNKNSRSLKIQWLNGSTWTDLMSKNDAYSQENTFTTADTLSFSVDKSYQIRAVCADYFGSVTVERSVDTSFSLIDLGSDGKSLAFGGVARDDGSFESFLPSHLRLRHKSGGWISGASPANSALYFSEKLASNSFSTIFGLQTAANHALCVGAIADRLGIFGYKAGRTENGYDSSLYLDIGNNTAYYNGSPLVNKLALLNWTYPVGSVKITTNNVNPATNLGGTWVQIAQGRTLIGAGTGNDGSVSNAFSAGSSGGKYQTALGVANLPGHTHGMNMYTSDTEAKGYGLTQAPGFGGRPIVGANGSSAQWSTNSTGSGTAFSLMQPYLVVYFWQRTA